MATRTLEYTNSLGTITDADDVYLMRGNVSITTNLDQSALATGLGSFRVAESWTGNIGDPTNPLKCDVDTGSAVLEYQASGGSMFFAPQGGSAVCSKLWMQANASLTLLGGGTVTRLECSRGSTSIAQAVTATTFRVGGSANCKLVGSAGTGPTTLDQTGGRIESERGATTVNQYGGTLIFQAAANNITTYNYTGGFTFIEQLGTITTFNAISGDLSRVKVAKPITITNTNIWATVQGAMDFLRHPKITFTNAATPIMGDGIQL